MHSTPSFTEKKDPEAAPAATTTINNAPKPQPERPLLFSGPPAPLNLSNTVEPSKEKDSKEVSTPLLGSNTTSKAPEPVTGTTSNNAPKPPPEKPLLARPQASKEKDTEEASTPLFQVK